MTRNSAEAQNATVNFQNMKISVWKKILEKYGKKFTDMEISFKTALDI